MSNVFEPLPMGGEMSPSHASRSPVSKKLTGRTFYESLGSPKMILAPMVDQSEFAWRVLTRSFMTPETSKDLLAYTPMLHARMFTETAKFRDHHFQPTKKGLATMPSPKDNHFEVDAFLDGNPAFDRPLTVQFCANEPDELLEAARYVQPYCDAVDLNLGCPQGIAKRGNYGAFLQEDWDHVYRLINILHRNLDIPVSAKIRVLETKERTLEYAKTIVSAGASMLTVHGRQRDQKGHKTGLADWSVIRHLKENLPPNTVLFANGNILRHEDIARCLQMTGADGIMSAEGNLHDPTIFAIPPAVGEEGREYWRGKDGKGGYRMDAVFRKYMDILYKHVLEVAPPERMPLFLPSDTPVSHETADIECAGNCDQTPAKRQKRDSKTKKPTSPNLLAMQPHLFRLLRPLVSQHTNVRDALARSCPGDMLAFGNVLRLVEEVTKEGLLDYEANPEKYESAPDEEETGGVDNADLTDYESSLAAVKACKRPWWVCQPYVRPLPKEALENGSLTLSKKERRKMEEEPVRMKESGAQSQGGASIREETDAKDGLERSEIAQEAMVCG
ncbi:hypothetical protein MMC13_004858 [Lambiella insularis]|nr:hypothetical protein [Lambiella insularis]